MVKRIQEEVKAEKIEELKSKERKVGRSKPKKKLAKEGVANTKAKQALEKKLLKKNKVRLDSIKEKLLAIHALRKAEKNNYERIFVLESGSKKARFKSSKSLITAV